MPGPSTSVLESGIGGPAQDPITSLTTPIWSELTLKRQVVPDSVRSSGGSYGAGAWPTQFGPECEVYVTLQQISTTGFFMRLKMTPIGTNGNLRTGYGIEINSSIGYLRLLRSNGNGTDTNLAQVNMAVSTGDSVLLRYAGGVVVGEFKAAAGSWQSVAGLSAADTTYQSQVGYLTWELPGNLSAGATNLGGGTMPVQFQSLAPSADSVDGTWTDQAGGTSLFATLDELTPSDTDYIQSADNPSNSGCRVKLASGLDPSVSTGHVLHWRIRKTGTQTVNMTVVLKQGGGDVLGAGTTIASFTRNGVSTSFTTFDEALSNAQADSITNYADLYLEFYATAV